MREAALTIEDPRCLPVAATPGALWRLALP